MDRLAHAELTELLQTQDAHCVTMLMPTHRSGKDNEQDSIRFRNLLDRAEKELTERGLRSVAARQMLEPARRRTADWPFWAHQADGLAVFLTPKRMRFFRTLHPFRETLVIGDRFYIVPLLPLVTENMRFYILAVSPRKVRLFRANRDTAIEVDVPEMPENLEEFTRVIVSEKQLQFHTRDTTIQNPAYRSAEFFGHSASDSETEQKIRLLEYSRAIDKRLQRVLAEEKAPMVLAGDKSLVPIYRQANNYANVLEESLMGNPDAQKPAELRDRAWSLIEPLFLDTRRRVLEAYGQAVGNGRGSHRLKEILPAAQDGRVANLLVVSDRQRWGRYDSDARTVEFDEQPSLQNEELVNRAVILTLQTGGEVLPMQPSEMPEPDPVAAIFRF